MGSSNKIKEKKYIYASNKMKVQINSINNFRGQDGDRTLEIFFLSQGNITNYFMPICLER